MGIGTFGSFTQARLAIYAAQAGIQVTGNNISNINTEGYTRQRLDQSSLYIGGSDRYSSKYDLRIGQGVLCTGVSQLRDPYLDLRFRNESAYVGYTDERLDTLNKIAYILDETGKGDKTEGADFGLISADLADLEDALRSLTLDTGHQEFDNQVRAAAVALCAKLNSYATRLQDEYNTQVWELEKEVEDINVILTKIRDLNETIRNSEIHGQDALELRDMRNNLLDQLSDKIHIDVTYVPEDIGGGVTVQKLIVSLAGDNPDSTVKSDSAELINGIYGAQISIDQVPQPNTKYDPNDKTSMPYLDAKGNLTSKLSEAEQVPKPNPNYDAAVTDTTLPGFGQYLKPDGTGTNDTNLAAQVPKENPDYLKYLKADGTATNDPAEAKQVNNSNFNLTVSELRDSREKLLIYTNKDVKEISAQAYKDAIAANHGPIIEVDNGDGTTTVTVYQKSSKGKYTETTYTQRPSVETPLDDNDLYGRLQAMREMLTEAGEFTDTEVVAETNNDPTDPYRNADESALVKRGIPYYQHALDLLANQLAKVMNEANNGFMMDKDGNYISKGVDDKGNTIGVPITITYTPTGTTDDVDYALNAKVAWDDIPQEVRDALETATGLDSTKVDGKTIIETYLTGKDADGNDIIGTDGNPIPQGIKVGVNLISNRGDTNDDTDITASNISVSDAWRKGSALVNSFIADPGKGVEPASGDSSNILHFQGLLDLKQMFYPDETPDTAGKAGHDLMFTGTFHEYWNNVGFTLGQDQNVMNNQLEMHYQNALEIDTGRDSVSSVDFNDEAMNLTMYAKSYNAACRLMTTIDSMLDKLVNGTGMTT